MPEYDPRVRHRIYWLQLVAYLLIVVVAIAGFYSSGRTQDRLCTAQAENRQAIRALTTAIAQLGQNLVLGDNDPKGSITVEQQRTLDAFEDFRQKQLAQLELPVCE